MSANSPAETSPDSSSNASNDIPWHLGIHDAHCHPTDTPSALPTIHAMRTRTLTTMATRSSDQSRVAALARSLPSKSIPAFGYHPWYSHLIYDDIGSPDFDKSAHYTNILLPVPDTAFIAMLPNPRPLSAVIEELQEHLEEFPDALVGEVGLDRGFRLPYTEMTPGHRGGKWLSPYRVTMEHQKVVFSAQVELAGILQRAVSVHGVQCHGAVFNIFRDLWSGEKPFPPRICLHSFSAPPETLRLYLRTETTCEVFFSFSTTINARPEKGHLGKVEKTVREVPEDRVLIESDMDKAGERLDGALADAAVYVCDARGWSLDEGVKILGDNWRRFVFGECKREEVETELE